MHVTFTYQVMIKEMINITSSMRSNPHSLFLISSIIFSDSSDRFPPKATMLYVVTTTPAFPRNLSLLSEVKRQIWSSRMFDHRLNWKAHWSTETAFVAKQRQLFFIRQAAETPTRDFPAPQGSTIIPDLALPTIDNFVLSTKITSCSSFTLKQTAHISSSTSKKSYALVALAVWQEALIDHIKESQII